ncbi:MAG: hypothetical protein H5T93_09885 [Pseudothermotoga sp.]|uniref:hypothetical protein n=1 Tax=Pseudothermotoga sp. TaxID=2033661 RepID=UPI0019833CCA|nr:hypothetical protein [Pseudothermotoga sp.]MBC7122387.1 hypothetical protein [Pseudothermotoga sp.]
MRVDGVSNNRIVPNFILTPKQPQEVTLVSKEDFLKLLSFAFYQQNGLNVKLVRIAVENYVKAGANFLA